MVYLAPWKVAVTLAVLLASIIVAVPNVLPRSVVDSLPSWLPARQVVLGLDLQGGSHLLLRVETDSVVNDYLDSVVDLVRASLREDRIGYRGLGVAAGRVRLTLTDPAEGDAAMTLLRAIDHDLSVERQGDAITVSLSQEAADARASNAVSQSIEIIRRRVDESGTTEPLIQRQGADRILVQLPGVDDPERMKSLLGRTARMTFHLVDEEVTAADIAGGRVPAGRLVLPVEGAGQQEAGRLAIERRTRVSGENLTDAQATFHQGQPVVSFRFDSLGARQFATITTENVGRRFAIVLDERIISAPVMREPILGGNGIISGSFSAQEVQDLALLLRAGALPAPLTIIEERTVGPSLGSDSISAGKLAAGVGLVIVTGFMLVTYGRFGLYANIALVSNIILLFAVLTALKATLTLPGIAGIVLTMGMAVDANVLIFERIREELRLGRSPIQAVDAGFSRAMGTIIDSNLTTLFATLFLFIFGSGPVRGFAVTLSVGILTSLFCAFMVSRLLIVRWLRARRPSTLTL